MVVSSLGIIDPGRVLNPRALVTGEGQTSHYDFAIEENCQAHDGNRSDVGIHRKFGAGMCHRFMRLAGQFPHRQYDRKCK